MGRDVKGYLKDYHANKLTLFDGSSCLNIILSDYGLFTAAGDSILGIKDVFRSKSRVGGEKSTPNPAKVISDANQWVG